MKRPFADGKMNSKCWRRGHLIYIFKKLCFKYFFLPELVAVDASDENYRSGPSGCATSQSGRAARLVVSTARYAARQFVNAARQFVCSTQVWRWK